MRSMYENYATEGQDAKGFPNGNFYVYKKDAYKAATEVVTTHLHLKKKEIKSYVDSEFKEKWARFDVNEDGFIDVDRMPQLLRSICGNAEACNEL